MSVSPRALEGLRVLDCSQKLAGPFCAMLLADMGADVVKVEPPEGDPSRVMAPTLAPGMSAPFLAVNRNKRSLVVDLDQPDGVALLTRLAVSADVIVGNHRSGAAEHPELRYDRLSTMNPRLIGCEISPFGRTGPYAGREGDDLIAQAMSGIMSATGSEGGAPATIGVPITELGAGLFGVFGILCALRARHRTGRGQVVDASLFDAGLSLSAWEATEYWFTGQVPRGLGTAHRLNAPYQAFRASDGHFTVGAANNNLFPRFCTLLGLEHLVKDARFDSVAKRLANRAVLEPLIEAVTVHRPRSHWLARCEEAGVPAGPIYSVPEALDDAHARARGMVQTLPHPALGDVRSLGNPVKMSATPPALTSIAPALGAHTDAVLREAGLGHANIADLRTRRVIV
jgi:crotonobetainyl-CoA:carnitine CoA-transferase CaiB-like acyl-CoA transferase